MTDELDMLVAGEEDKVKDEKAALESALEAKIDAIDEDINTRTALIRADAQRNIDLMIAAAERKKEQLTKKVEQKAESVKTVPKTGKILALEKKIRSKEDVVMKAQQFLDFCKRHNNCATPLTKEEMRRPPRTDWSKMPNGEPYPFKDDLPTGKDEDTRSASADACPYSPTEMAYRAAALAES